VALADGRSSVLIHGGWDPQNSSSSSSSSSGQLMTFSDCFSLDVQTMAWSKVTFGNSISRGLNVGGGPSNGNGNGDGNGDGSNSSSSSSSNTTQVLAIHARVGHSICFLEKKRQLIIYGGQGSAPGSVRYDDIHVYKYDTEVHVAKLKAKRVKKVAKKALTPKLKDTKE
jgi:hypothetical protein